VSPLLLVPHPRLSCLTLRCRVPCHCRCRGVCWCSVAMEPAAARRCGCARLRGGAGSSRPRACCCDCSAVARPYVIIAPYSNYCYTTRILPRCRPFLPLVPFPTLRLPLHVLFSSLRVLSCCRAAAVGCPAQCPLCCCPWLLFISHASRVACVVALSLVWLLHFFSHQSPGGFAWLRVDRLGVPRDMGCVVAMFVLGVTMLCAP
jgi:hypothetical protein